MALLNKVLGTLNNLLDKYELEQVKQVGDAVIVAGPLQMKNKESNREQDTRYTCKRICDMAIDLVATIDIPLHVGIHIGPVVAGVIGRKRFTYDIYGETVDVANELGSIGSPGKVCVTEAVKEFLPSEYLYEPMDTLVGDIRPFKIFSITKRISYVEERRVSLSFGDERRGSVSFTRPPSNISPSQEHSTTLKALPNSLS